MRDEQDIVEPFIRHNLRFLDAMMVADNDSTDRTPEILAALAREDDRLIVGRVPGFGHAQSERLTELLYLAIRWLKPQFVLPLDADEFIRADGPGELRDALRTIGPGQTGLIPWQTYVLPANKSQTAGDPPRCLTVRRAEERPGFRKVAIRVDGDTPPDLVIEIGSHAVARRSGVPIPMPDVQAIQLVHIPIRSREQFVGKVLAGWLAILMLDRAAAATPICTHWQQMFERIVNGPELSDAELRELSITYAQDPSIAAAETRLVTDRIAWNYTRQFSSGRCAPPVIRLAKSWHRHLAGDAGSPLREGIALSDIEAWSHRLLSRRQGT